MLTAAGPSTHRRQPTDYTASLRSAVLSAGHAAPVWFHHSDNLACDVIRKRAEKGPIHARDAAYMAMLMPFSFLFSMNPIIPTELYNSKDALANPGPGIQTCYSFYGVLQSKTSACTVVVTVTRVTINPLTKVSVWVINSGVTDPDTKAWITQKPVFLDDAQVRQTPNGVVIAGNVVNGQISMSPQDITVTLSYEKSGFEMAVTATSASGLIRPTPGKPTSLSAFIRALDWCMVDGSVSKTAPTSSSFINLRQTGGVDKRVFFSSGKAWFDFKTLEVPRFSAFNKFLVSMFSKKHAVVKYVALRIQSPNVNLRVFISDAKAIDTLLLKRSVKCAGVVTYWKDKTFSQRPLGATINIVSSYTESHMPSVMRVYVPDMKMSFTLTSQTSKPLVMHDVNGERFISPAFVSFAGEQQIKGTGLMEWVPGNVYPVQRDYIEVSEVDAALINSAWKGNPLSRAAFGLGMSIIFLVYIFILVCAVTYAVNTLRSSRRVK